MKRASVLGFLLLMAAVLPLVSCAEGPVVQRRVPFNEAEFKWTRGKGTGAVDGQAFIELKDKSVWYGRHSLIMLFPVNAYTTEFITRRYDNGENLAMADDRMAQYLCDEHADGEGAFSMRDLAPGEYYVGATVDFHYYYYNDDGTKAWVYKYQYIHARVTVGNGQTTHVTNWSQGAGKLY
jgi:hypothetical protein